MRKFSSEFAAHLKSGATSICNCWLLTLQNDTQLGFTDHDQILHFEGVDFEPRAGFQPSAMTTKRNASIDTSEVIGLIDDDRISEAALEAGLFAGAQVDWWWVNWRNVNERHQMRRDYVGEIKQIDGQFEAELRSGHAALNQMRGRLYQRNCDAQFGDSKCKLNKNSSTYSSIVTVTEIIKPGQIRVSGLSSRAAGWAKAGRLEWQSGAHKNETTKVTQHARDGGHDILDLDRADSAVFGPGDTARLVVGCDKQFTTCRDKFGNQLNFQGFPHIPGDDFVLRYPRAGDDLSGGVLFQ